ncbi:sulfatase-like hydrolase/transferase [Bifidobacterium magnum]|uniref:Phosphoglycerol transferase n=1 Tax=Bifidobacterium magnum TaxID=1692 RepID=A0A087BE17_9BIFI|nr:sulfatase-like hydrolase/transferase [Bifidobacterium magnum]KFI69267.1 Phosphoglycerol transferase [Bifidobacterium magnum]
MNSIERLDIKTVDPAQQAMRKHKPFRGWLYAVLFIVIDFLCLAILQIGVSEPTGKSSAETSVAGLGDMITKLFTQGNCVLLLNLLIIGLVYLVVLMVANRFWVASPIMVALALIISVIEHFKMELRYEVVQPADLAFIHNGNAGELTTFMPSDAAATITMAAVVMAVVIALCAWLNHIDGRHGSMIRMSGKAKGLGAIIRILLIVLPVGALGLYTHDVGTTDSWAYHVSRGMGDTPSMWDSVYDAQRNGVLPAFLRVVNPKVMDKPADYSEATMKQIADRYAKEADAINKNRADKLTNSTVIAVLSESLADPDNVPGVTLNEDPMPNIHAIMENTTSGKMLSSGYGGGTANLEYMELTGLSMANFDSSLTSPYQQLVPAESWTPTFNQMWGKQHSIALHPYEASMYSRESNYKKFGFSHFYALNGGTDVISHQDKLDDSPYVCDKAAYESTLEQVESTKDPQFVQLMTMQNHMPYNNWYKNNEFKATNTEDSPALKESETEAIDTYAKGVQHTDEATADFLERLDSIDKPITVIFYGDHLPGIYKTAGEDSANSIALHETNYFIWSNKASGRQGVKIDDSAYSSPNFFMAQAADQMDAKVSPYLAFLERLHANVAAMEPPVVNTIQGWDRIPEGNNIYLDQDGKEVAYADLDAQAKQLLSDYKLIQYDITAGNHYLKDTSFMSLPDNAGTM